MPTYEYECTKCAHIFDWYQSMTSPHLKTCPKCKGKLKRLIGSGSGLMFKGTGFYETDYKKKNTADSPRPEKASEPKKSTKKPSEKKTD